VRHDVPVQALHGDASPPFPSSVAHEGSIVTTDADFVLHDEEAIGHSSS
jgi:hypothetical protein